MKKIFFALIVIGTFSLTACKKDRVCECTSDGLPNQKVTLNDASKRQAKDNCVSRSYEDNGKTIKYTCELK